MELDPIQQQAIDQCCNSQQRIVGVTGQAGTGKTTLMRMVYTRLTEKLGENSVIIAAPTGKAAKRIQEATGIEARTIHRLLEYPHPGERDPKTGKTLNTTEPRRHRQNPLEARVVLVDEYAMVNQELHRNLIDALPHGGMLRCFGDINQLPPIEQTDHFRAMPSPFNDILTRFPCTKLDIIHRQDEGSQIVLNGNRIIKGFVPIRSDEFEIITTDQPHDALRRCLVDAAARNVSYEGITAQILTPSNKTWVGTVRLNQVIQDAVRRDREFSPKAFSPDRHTWDKEKVIFDVGEKVIITNNNYDLKVFNGESGLITDIDDSQVVHIDLGDRVVQIPPLCEFVHRNTNTVKHYNPQRDLQLAYAITTHKAQGSEYQEIIYVMNKSTKFMQSRPNYYTAITRARRRVTVITDATSNSYAVWKKVA